MKTKALVLSLALILSSMQSAFAAGGQEGNGGAGIVRDGRYMTFYSAGLYTEPQPIEPLSIPSLNDLISFIDGFTSVSQEVRTSLLQAMIPSGSREYYKVQENKLDEATKARLIAEFSRVTGQPAEALSLFAITDTSSRTTYLFPSFFQLSRQDQVAILFHEAYWIRYPHEKYDSVIRAEIAFQAVLNEPRNYNRVSELLKYIGAAGDRLLAAIQRDQATGALNGFLKSGEISLNDLLGRDAMECLKTAVKRENLNPDYGNFSCRDLAETNAYFLTRKYPNSQILKLFHEALAARDRDHANGRAQDFVYDRDGGYVLLDFIDFHRRPAQIAGKKCSVSLSVEFSVPTEYSGGGDWYGMPVSCRGGDYHLTF